LALKVTAIWCSIQTRCLFFARSLFCCQGREESIQGYGADISYCSWL